MTSTAMEGLNLGHITQLVNEICANLVICWPEAGRYVPVNISIANTEYPETSIRVGLAPLCEKKPANKMNHFAVTSACILAALSKVGIEYLGLAGSLYYTNGHVKISFYNGVSSTLSYNRVDKLVVYNEEWEKLLAELSVPD